MASEEAPSRRILIYGVQEENGSHVQNFALDLTPPPEVVYKSEPGTSDGMNVLGIVIFSATMGMCCLPPQEALEPGPPCIYPSLHPVSSNLNSLESPHLPGGSFLSFSEGVTQVPIPLPKGKRVSLALPELELLFRTGNSPSLGAICLQECWSSL